MLVSSRDRPSFDEKYLLLNQEINELVFRSSSRDSGICELCQHLRRS